MRRRDINIWATTPEADLLQIVHSDIRFLPFAGNWPPGAITSGPLMLHTAASVPSDEADKYHNVNNNSETQEKSSILQASRLTFSAGWTSGPRSAARRQRAESNEGIGSTTDPADPHGATAKP